MRSSQLSRQDLSENAVNVTSARKESWFKSWGRRPTDWGDYLSEDPLSIPRGNTQKSVSACFEGSFIAYNFLLNCTRCRATPSCDLPREMRAIALVAATQLEEAEGSTPSSRGSGITYDDIRSDCAVNSVGPGTQLVWEISSSRYKVSRWWMLCCASLRVNLPTGGKA